MSFSDWGNRQQSDWKTGLPSGSFPTANGFTGHHQLDQHKLVHMGGRVYDPNLGRFLSADLFVQSPYSSQSYNRYSYVSNNPLSRIDPTGYEDIETITVTGYINFDFSNLNNYSFAAYNDVTQGLLNYSPVTGLNFNNYTGDTITAVNGNQLHGAITLLTGGIIHDDDEFQDEANERAVQERFGKGLTLVAKYGPYLIGIGEVGAVVKFVRGVPSVVTKSVPTWKGLDPTRSKAVNTFMQSEGGNSLKGAEGLLAKLKKDGVPEGLDKEAFTSYRNQIASGRYAAGDLPPVVSTRLEILDLILKK